MNKYIDIIYPNPSTDQIVVEHHFDGKEDLLVRVFDAQGRQVDAQRIDASGLSQGQITWDVTDYGTGQYSLNFIYGGENLGSVPFIKL